MNLKERYPEVDIEITGISIDSRTTKDSELFISLNDNEDNINEAISKKAICLITRHKKKRNINSIIVKDPYAELAFLSSLWFHHPSLKLHLWGVTGTDGKTTTATILAHLLDGGYIGTNGFAYNNQTIKTENTTPNPLILNQCFQTLLDNDIKTCTMELSSHGIKQKRVHNLLFDGVIFTNLSQEHLDYHKSMKKYFEDKCSVLNNVRDNGVIITNNDDYYGRKVKEKYPQALTFGIENDSTLQAINITKTIHKTSFDIQYKGLIYPQFVLNLPLRFNIYNALGAILASLCAGLSMSTIRERLMSLKQIEGRLINLTPYYDIQCLVDFAHTPNALYHLLKEIRFFTRGNLIIVFGAGGHKCREKRALMGLISTHLADFVIMTGDDPKDENLNDIFSDLVKKIRKENYLIIPSRSEAIACAIKIANPQDTVLITGKGHEDYFLEKGKSIKYSDINEVKSSLKVYKNIHI